MRPLRLYERMCALLISIFVCGPLFSQVRGIITDLVSGERLPAATVIISRNGQSTASNSSGKFDINARAGDTLSVSYVGYKTKAIFITSQTFYLSIGLEPEIAQLNDMVVTGVFDPRKSMRSSISITTITADELERNILFGEMATSEYDLSFTPLMNCGSFRRINPSFMNSNHLYYLYSPAVRPGESRNITTLPAA